MERQNILRGEELMEKKKDIIRCAIYCRKSVEKGLDMEFNTLDAQREAAEAYIASQKANGWVCLPEHYDDGGFSGGTLNRPALRKLLLDCESGKVDVIVVYKIDRLSRSLCDFADLSRFAMLTGNRVSQEGASRIAGFFAARAFKQNIRVPADPAGQPGFSLLLQLCLEALKAFQLFFRGNLAVKAGGSRARPV